MFKSLIFFVCYSTLIHPTSETLSLLERAEMHLGRKGLKCSEFMDHIIREYNTDALQTAPTVAPDGCERPYVSTTGFMWCFFNLPTSWEALPPTIAHLKPQTILTYTAPDQEIDPHTWSVIENHTLLIKDIIAITPIPSLDGWQAITVSVIDSSVRHDDGSSKGFHEVTLNHRRIFIANADGVLCGFRWLKNTNTLHKKHFVLGRLRQESYS